MSKETFSKKISEIMTEKTLYLDNLAYDILFKKDEYFELALCISYMTLSKEKIIKKDMNNPNRLDRLTRMVSESDIDKVFDPKYFKSLPNIIYSKETDKTWILDNIRDSIMHGAFDIDEEKQCFLINNNQYDRELIAEIPFSWFIEYSKYDILSKKTVNQYTVKGFYYNVNKTNKKYLHTKKELINNILYNVNVTGDSFNINDIENRIKELFEQYSKQEISENEIIKYQERIDSERIKYNPKYLTSFYIASEKVKETIEKEYPNTKVQIYINNRKSRLVNKLTKRLANYYKNYDVIYNEFNNAIDKKSNSLLRKITTIIENIDNIPTDYNNLNYYQIMDMFNQIIQGKKIEYTNEHDIYNSFNNSIKTLREICLNVYGLTTLVINQENLYNPYFLNEKPSQYGLKVYTKQIYLDYANLEKNLTIKKIEKEIKLYEKAKQLSNCTNLKGIQHLTNEIQSLTLDYEQIKKDLNELPTKLNYIPHIDYKKVDYLKMEKIEKEISYYKFHLKRANSVEAKNKLKKLLSKSINKKIEYESTFTYGYCNNMKEALTVIRNCFSHIGRININKQYDLTCFLTDYDNNQEPSGFVYTHYKDLINLLSIPLIDNSKKSTQK